MVELLCVLVVVLLIMTGGLHLWKEASFESQAQTITNRVTAIKNARQVFIDVHSGRSMTRQEKGPHDTILTIENGVGEQNEDWFWIVVKTTNIALCDFLVEYDVEADRVTNNCEESKEVVFYFQKFSGKESSTTPDRFSQPKECPQFAICNSDFSPIGCQSGAYFKDGICNLCPQNSNCTEEDFECLKGFFKEENECTSCGVGVAECDEDGEPLECEEAYYLNDDQCVACPTEGLEECYTDDFSCLSGYYKNGTECTPCAVGESCSGCADAEYPLWDGEKCVCSESSCDGRACLDTGICCPEHAVCGEEVKCELGYALTDGECKPCIEGDVCSSCENPTYPNWDGEKCVCTKDSCLSGEECNESGRCVVDCPENASRTVIEGNRIASTECYCKEGYRVEGNGCVSVCLGGAEYTTFENAKGEATNVEHCYCPESKPYWNLGSEECTETQIIDCLGTLTDDGVCCPAYRVYQSGEENLCCNLTCESSSQVLDVATCSCLGCTGEGCCPSGSILCNLQCCDIGAACNTTTHQCCQIGEVMLNGFCCPFGTTAASSKGCCELGQKVVNNLCCNADALETTTVNPERTAYTCCDGVTFNWYGPINWITSSYRDYQICCPKDSTGYAHNDKMCCGSGETVVSGHCCPAGSTHYAPDADGKYICCSDDLYSDYEQKCTDGVERWVVVSECSKLKISCPRTSLRACGTDCCDNDEKYCNLDHDTGLYYCCKDRHEEVTQCESNI